MPRLVTLIFFFVFMIDETHASDIAPPSFTVYAYIPWEKDLLASQNDLLKYGIQAIKVIYENAYSVGGKISSEKIKRIAEGTYHEANIPVSFDIESGNRFKPRSVIPTIKQVLTSYHQYKPKALVGVYAVMPQNTYGWKPSIESYDQLNAQYTTLATYVDYVSPSLYNYNGRDFEAWAKSARYNIQAAKKYFPNKPIIPYISPVYKIGVTKQVRNGSIVEELDETAMLKRLQLLQSLGASGCIIWASSQDRTQDGRMPRFSPDSAWGKAVVDFIKYQAQGA